MIRKSRPTDTEAIVAIWLAASVKTHDFMTPAYWQSKVDDMRDIYIPASETYVHEKDGTISGFVSMDENRIAALFVRPDLQGQGIGSALIKFVKRNRQELSLYVYKRNTRSIAFYKKHGFQKVCEQVDEHTNALEIKMINS